MAKTPAKLSSMVWFSLLLGALFAFLFLLVFRAGGFLTTERYYSTSWQVEHERAEARKAELNEEDPSQKSTEPRGPGFREAELKKYRGHGYDTF